MKDLVCFLSCQTNALLLYFNLVASVVYLDIQFYWDRIGVFISWPCVSLVLFLCKMYNASTHSLGICLFQISFKYKSVIRGWLVGQFKFQLGDEREKHQPAVEDLFLLFRSSYIDHIFNHPSSYWFYWSSSSNVGFYHYIIQHPWS